MPYTIIWQRKGRIPGACACSCQKHIPFSPLAAGSIGNIVAKACRLAGIRQEPGDRKGTHIFRHSLASSMLENGVPQPVITQTLGHTAPDSLEPYLRADFVHLKECALSIEAFPLAEEVFSL